MITNKAQLNLVIGYPLAHSKSSLLHNFVYQQLNMDVILLPLPNPAIKPLVNIIKDFPIGLTCVTMPFKQSIMKFLHVIDRQAKAIGAVNTVINKNGKLLGFNTDVDGIAVALSKVVLKNKTVLLLGAGGAARAAAYYVSKQGGKILYLNRTKAKAVMLQKEFGGRVMSYQELDKYPADIIINATPIGMFPKVSETPLQKKYLKKSQTVFDIVYSSKPTQLLKDAKKVGAKVIPGMDMFIGQGLRQIELFSGKKIINPKLVSQVKKQLSF